MVYGTCKLLDLLGYGSMIASSNTAKAAITKKYLGLDNVSDGDNPLVYLTSQSVNMLPLLAYQKIYFDFFSNSRWEKHLAYSYNVDYWLGNNYITLYPDMVKMRYANYPKDYFMGMLPSSQYGSVALLPALDSSLDPSVVRSYLSADNLSGVSSLTVAANSSSVSVTSAAANQRSVRINADLSTLLS